MRVHAINPVAGFVAVFFLNWVLKYFPIEKSFNGISLLPSADAVNLRIGNESQSLIKLLSTTVFELNRDKPFQFQVIYDSKHEDTIQGLSQASQEQSIWMVMFQYDASEGSLRRMLASASGTTLLLPLCSVDIILHIFRMIKHRRLESHFVRWLLIASSEEELDEITIGLEGIIHEGTRVALLLEKDSTNVAVFSSQIDGEGVVRFYEQGYWNPTSKDFDKGYLSSLTFDNEDHLYTNMKGRPMKVAANDFAGFFAISPDSPPDGPQRLLGIDGAIVESLSSALNFTYEIVRPPDGAWGNPLPDGTVTGVVGMAARREVAFALCAITVTAGRDSVVDFGYPYWIENLALFSRAPKEKNRALAVLSPFTLEVWLWLIVTSLAIAPILTLQSKASEFFLEENSEWTSIEYLFNMFRIFVIQGNRIKSKHWPQRIIVYSWYLFCLLVSVLYSGMLTAVLAIPAFETPIDSLVDLPRAVKEGFTIGLMKDTSIEALFKEATEGLFKETWQLFDHSENSESFVRRPDIGITKARDSKYVFIGVKISYQILSIRKGRRKFHVGRQAFYSHSIGIVCPTGVPYLKTFSLMTMRMMEGGLLTKWRKDELDKVASLSSGEDNEDIRRTYAINVVHLQAAFFIVGIGCSIAAIVLGIEVLAFHFRLFLDSD